jgi:acyl-CoA thioesterase FadM
MTDDPARITLVRRIEWRDTDAAGVYHWSTVFRLVEAAEAALHDRLGIRQHTFGRTPRVHVSCDFRLELAFYDAVRIELVVAEVGRTSVRYAFSLYAEEEEEEEEGGGPAAEGEMVAVHVTGAPGGTADPWPPELRERLTGAGDQGRVDHA